MVKLALKIMFSFGEIKLENEKKNMGEQRTIFASLLKPHFKWRIEYWLYKENGIKIGNFMRP